MPPGVMSPGTYLRKRREAAGLDLRTTAARLAGLPWVLRAPSERDVGLLAARLGLVEADRWDLTRPQLDLVRTVIRIDPQVYEQLVQLHQAGPDSGLPIPSICRACGCTWFVACVDDDGHACSWASAAEDLCTACAPAAQPDWPDAPQPEGEAA